MALNKSEKELIKLLQEANTWHPNIQLDYKMGKNLPFLDILLMNKNSILSTSVYHKLSAEPYVVPFMSNYPEHVFGNVIQTRDPRYAVSIPYRTVPYRAETRRY